MQSYDDNDADVTDDAPVDPVRSVPDDWYGEPLFFAVVYAWLSSPQMAARHFGLSAEDIADFQRRLFSEEPTREPTKHERRRCQKEAERMGFGPDNPVRRDVVRSLIQQLMTPPPFQAFFPLDEATRWTTMFEATTISHGLDVRGDSLPTGCLGPHPVVPILRWEELFEFAAQVDEPVALTFLLSPCCTDPSTDQTEVTSRLEALWRRKLGAVDLQKIVDFMLCGEPDDRERQRLKTEAEQLGMEGMMPPSGRIEASWSQHRELGWITEAPNSYRNPDCEYGTEWEKRDGFHIFGRLVE